MEDAVAKNNTFQKVVASASLISSISSSSGVFFEVRSSSIKRLISFAFASLKIPANLINAQTPEHSRVIVDDFINQIGLDHGTTPDVIQQDGSAYWSSGNEGSRVHVAPLELLVRLAGVTRIGFAGVCAGLRLVPLSDLYFTPRVLLLDPAMRPMPSRSRSQGLELQKLPTFFSLPRQPPLVISRDTGKHRGMDRPLISRPMRVAPRLGAPHVKSMPIPQPVVSTHPQTSAWTQVADHVVGRHPQGKPLISRVATRAEIALISGHVHIPWAYTHAKKNQPVPVRVQKPAAVYNPLSIVPSLALEDLGNIQGLHIWRAVNNNAKLFMDKGLHHARENIPIAPRPARSSRR